MGAVISYYPSWSQVAPRDGVSEGSDNDSKFIGLLLDHRGMEMTPTAPPLDRQLVGLLSVAMGQMPFSQTFLWPGGSWDCSLQLWWGSSCQELEQVVSCHLKACVENKAIVVDPVPFLQQPPNNGSWSQSPSGFLQLIPSNVVTIDSSPSRLFLWSQPIFFQVASHSSLSESHLQSPSFSSHPLPASADCHLSLGNQGDSTDHLCRTVSILIASNWVLAFPPRL